MTFHLGEVAASGWILLVGCVLLLWRRRLSRLIAGRMGERRRVDTGHQLQKIFFFVGGIAIVIGIGSLVSVVFPSITFIAILFELLVGFMAALGAAIAIRRLLLSIRSN